VFLSAETAYKTDDVSTASVSKLTGQLLMCSLYQKTKHISGYIF